MCYGINLLYTILYYFLLLAGPLLAPWRAGPTIYIQYPLSIFFSSLYHNIVI